VQLHVVVGPELDLVEIVDVVSHTKVGSREIFMLSKVKGQILILYAAITCPHYGKGGAIGRECQHLAGSSCPNKDRDGDLQTTHAHRKYKEIMIKKGG
jgi:hypothetical protein